MPQDENPQSRLSVWILAARPKTLWAAVAPVLVGSALAWRDGGFQLVMAGAALWGAVALQIGANFANDLYDYERGADTPERLGPLRMTQAGLVTPRGMRVALWLVLSMALFVGVVLVWRGGWPVVAIGLASMVAAVLYTGGPFPYGYRALGELFVFVFFGLVAVAGTYYVQTLSVTGLAVVLGVPMGLLASAILVVNNLRDIDTDSRSGKTTLAVLLGRTGTRWLYLILMVVAALVPLVLYLDRHTGPGVLLASAIMLWAVPLVRTVFGVTDGPALNQVLAQTARVQLVYGLLLTVGLNL